MADSKSQLKQLCKARIDPAPDRLLIELRTAGRKMCGKCRDQLIAAMQRASERQRS